MEDSKTNLLIRCIIKEKQIESDGKLHSHDCILKHIVLVTLLGGIVVGSVVLAMLI